MYYLLGWLVGDTGKNFSRSHPWARIQLDLSRKYPQNLQLGTFVMNSVSLIGISCGRIADSPPRNRDSHGLYRWMSYFSEVFVWFHTACLGLAKNQLTSYDPVNMDWLLTASHVSILWFLRGVADSDGTVSIRNRTVEITSEPNANLFKNLFELLGVHSRIHRSKGVGYVTMSALEAARVCIFNPEIETHRGVLLNTLAGAQTFQARWPAWLEERVADLIHEGLDPRTIRNKLLFEDGTYVKLKTLKSKIAKFTNGAGGGLSARQGKYRSLDLSLTRRTL